MGRWGRKVQFLIADGYVLGSQLEKNVYASQVLLLTKNPLCMTVYFTFAISFATSAAVVALSFKTVIWIIDVSFTELTFMFFFNVFSLR